VNGDAEDMKIISEDFLRAVDCGYIDIARWDYFDNENARFFIFYKSISAESPPFS